MRNLIEQYMLSSSQAQQDLVTAKIVTSPSYMFNDGVSYKGFEAIKWMAVAEAMLGQATFANGNGIAIVLEQSGLCSTVADLKLGRILRETRWVPIEAVPLFMIRAQRC